MIKKRAAIIRSSQNIGSALISVAFEFQRMSEEAKEIDAANGDTLWWNAICKMLHCIRDEMTCQLDTRSWELHLVFDVKLGENHR